MSAHLQLEAPIAADISPLMHRFTPAYDGTTRKDALDYPARYRRDIAGREAHDVTQEKVRFQKMTARSPRL